jgi:hypothetical protein
MNRLPAFVFGLALLACAGDVAVPMKDGSVLRGERIEDAAVADRAGSAPAAPSPNPPVAPSPWGDSGDLPPVPEDEVRFEPYSMMEGEAPELPACCDPRF